MFLPKDFGTSPEDIRETQIGSMEDVVRESAEAERFCLSHGMKSTEARWMALFVEEMAGNIFRHGKTKTGRAIRVDFRLFVDGNRIGLCLRDCCGAFDVLRYYQEHGTETDPDHTGIRIVMSHASDIQYYNTFNSNNLLLYIRMNSGKDGMIVDSHEADFEQRVV